MWAPKGWKHKRSRSSGAQHEADAGRPAQEVPLPAPLPESLMVPAATNTAEAVAGTGSLDSGSFPEPPLPVGFYHWIYMTTRSEEQTTRVMKMVALAVLIVALLFVVVTGCMVIVIKAAEGITVPTHVPVHTYIPAGLLTTVGVVGLSALGKWIWKGKGKKGRSRLTGDQESGTAP